jgi:mRNA-degrading endonuclease RelE of RelBE toxin-antitoxin system
MRITIHREASFKKALKALEKGDRAASAAAERAKEIISKLAAGEHQAIELQNRRTHNGELRIGGCRKYNLGGGYRLVCIKQKSRLLATFVGSHDDCNRWIENNRGFEKAVLSTKLPSLHAKESATSHHGPKRQVFGSDCDDRFLARLDQKILRRIFNGISGEF